MQTTPGAPTVRTVKVRSSKAAVPKSSSKTPPTAAKADQPAVPRQRKTLTKKPAPLVMMVADLTQQIATAAYYLAEQRQFAPGYELQDWLTAEQQILASASRN